MTETSTLAEMIMDDRRKGLSYLAIGSKHGIDPLEAREMVRTVIENIDMDDEWEMRGIAMLRLEKVIEHLWKGVETGSSKHAETLIKAIETTSSLLALNKQVMEKQRAAISDEQAALIYHILSENNKQIFQFVTEKLKPNKRQLVELESWPTLVSDTATNVIEATIYEGDDDEE